MHGGAAQTAADFALGACEHWHDQQCGAGENDSRKARLWSSALPEVAKRLENDVGGEGEEAGSDNAECDALVAFAVMDVGVDLHPPEKRGAGDHLDKAVEAEADERD